MRTVVPLVRSLGPEALSKPIVLEFYVPEYPENPHPAIFIGVRVAADDMSAAADRSDRLREPRISANAHLYQLNRGSTELQALERGYLASTGEVQFTYLDDAGHVPGLRHAGADFRSMQRAGLLRQGVYYQELKWASLYRVHPGRYRLILRIKDQGESLQRENAELLVAFSQPAK